MPLKRKTARSPVRKTVKRATTKKKPAKRKSIGDIAGLYQDYVFRSPSVLALREKIEDLKEKLADLIADKKAKYKATSEKVKKAARKAY